MKESNPKFPQTPFPTLPVKSNSMLKSVLTPATGPAFRLKRSSSRSRLISVASRKWSLISWTRWNIFAAVSSVYVIPTRAPMSVWSGSPSALWVCLLVWARGRSFTCVPTSALSILFKSADEIGVDGLHIGVLCPFCFTVCLGFALQRNLGESCCITSPSTLMLYGILLQQSWSQWYKIHVLLLRILILHLIFTSVAENWIPSKDIGIDTVKRMSIVVFAIFKSRYP